MTKTTPKRKPKPKRAKGPKRLSMAAYARHRGVTRKAVDKAISQGRISRKAARKNDRGHWEIDAALADREWAANSVRESAGDAADRRQRAVAAVPAARRRFLFDASQVPVNEDGEPLSITEVRTIREAVMAERDQIEVAVLKGELVRKTDAERAAAEVGWAVNNALLAIPARLAKQLASTSDPADVEIALEAAIVDALGELADFSGEGATGS